MRSALRLAAFRRLAISYALNELSWSFGTIALAVLVYQRTGEPVATASLFVLSALLPGLVAPAIVARLDRRPPAEVLRLLYLAEGGLFAVLAVWGDRLGLGVVLALAAVDGALAVSGRALTRAAVGAVLEPAGLLREGNAALNVAFSVSLALGPAAAGLLEGAAGPRAALGCAAGLFAAMALNTARARLPVVPRAPAGPAGQGVRAALAFVRSVPLVTRVGALHAAAFTAATAVVPVEVVFADRVLDGGPRTYGWMLAAWGVGTVAGSAAFARLGRVPARALVLAAFAVLGTALALVAATASVVVVLLACALGGAGNGVGYVAVVQALQEATPAGLQARLMALLESVNAAATGMGYLLGGVLGALAGPRAVFAVAGVLVLGTTLVAVGPVLGASAPAGGAHDDVGDAGEGPDQLAAVAVAGD